MDELEQRIAAHELALIEVVAHMGSADIVEGIRASRSKQKIVHD
jgi:hypothetical protein